MSLSLHHAPRNRGAASSLLTRVCRGAIITALAAASLVGGDAVPVQALPRRCNALYVQYYADTALYNMHVWLYWTYTFAGDSEQADVEKILVINDLNNLSKDARALDRAHCY